MFSPKCAVSSEAFHQDAEFLKYGMAGESHRVCPRVNTAPNASKSQKKKNRPIYRSYFIQQYNFCFPEYSVKDTCDKNIF